MKKCPDCQTPMILERGEIYEPSTRVQRPASFWSCYACGHCEEAT